MAKDNTKELVEKTLKNLNKKAEVNEAYFVGLCWSDPFNNYSEYTDELAEDEFIHDVWSFYFELGRKMYADGIKKFDEITVNLKVKEYNVVDEFNEYGKLTPINDAVDIVKDNIENIDYYYETIKRNYTIRQLYLLFGKQVILNKGNYKWEEMTRELLVTYWNDKINQISLGSVSKYESENLYIDSEEFIRKLEEESADMLPYHNSFLLNSISQGVPKGHVTMLGGFGGTGKSSIVADKFIMSCIFNKEKAVLVLNEEDAQSFRQKIVLSILSHEFKTGFDRKRMVNGKLQESDKVLIRKAFKRMQDLTDGEEALIKVIFMEQYVIKDLGKIVRFWANRGYENLVIDTHKVSSEGNHDSRWETFVEDTKTIYSWTRKNAGGMNLRTLITFQLADTTIRNRYLDFEAVGEGKKAKNEASIMYMFRVAWHDEYEGQKRELDCYRLEKNKRTDKFEKQYFTLEKGKIYYLLFTPKNRFGKDSDTGQPVLVIEPNFNFNSFNEIGWCFVANEKAGR